MDFDPATLRNGLIFYLLLLVILCLRTYAQAWTANRLGDRTPALNDRLTLNPVPHIDLLGTVLLPLICIFYLQPRLDQFAFFLAWTKPMPINHNNFAQPRKHYLYTQFAQTGMGILLALIGAVIGGLLYRTNAQTVEIFGALIMINASLIVLDCLPLPPLPGGTLLMHLGVMSEETYLNISRWSGLIFIILINLSFCNALLNLLVGIIATPFFVVMQAFAL
jgi:Zn-dependent protease